MTSASRLLVVDDSEAERELISAILGAVFPEAEIVSLADPRLVKDACASQPFDCVLTDYNMPELNGVALAAELRSAFSYLPIVLMSNVGDEMLAVKALHSGISDYIPKSRITTESIRRTIERSMQICSQERLVDEQRHELENFAFALAHDFKQPIRQISTLTQLISKEIQENDLGEIHQQLKFLGDAARRLGKLVDVMSTYTLLNQPPILADIDLADVLAIVKASLGPSLSERAAELSIPCPAPIVHGNETLMIQVLQNIIMNGLQYNVSATPRIDITAHQFPDHWVLEIKDNGIGIEAEYLTDIFKPLIRLHTASEYPGSGIGLALAKKAVVSQNGAIWCCSTPGEGSVFHVQLPLGRIAAGRTRTARAPSRRGLGVSRTSFTGAETAKG